MSKPRRTKWYCGCIKWINDNGDYEDNAVKVVRKSDYDKAIEAIKQHLRGYTDPKLGAFSLVRTLKELGELDD
ncbi:MAG: hypothetical protein GY861_18020 [bacterium]|nr:hypothetical protein [bacterium]